MKASVIVILLSFAAAACVDVNIGPRRIKHASDVHYKEPDRPFEKDDRSDVDAAWKNGSNGNLISFLSDCQDDYDPALDGIVQDTLTGLSDLKIESTQSPTFQAREARRVVATGKVDGVPSKIDLLVFKRNRCTYILTYVGVLNAFDADHAKFDQFLKEFRAP